MMHQDSWLTASLLIAKSASVALYLSANIAELDFSQDLGHLQTKFSETLGNPFYVPLLSVSHNKESHANSCSE